MTDVSTYLRTARSRRGTDPRTWKHERTMSETREWIDALSDHVGDWQGVPIPLSPDNPVVLAVGHPLREFFRDEIQHTCSVKDVREDEYVINHWFCHQRNCDVYVVDRGGRRFAVVAPVSPDRSMDRLTMWVQTMGAADAWDPKAEHAARETLRAMLTERQWMHYDMTGAFFETSPRSHITYVFRRLRPTIAMSATAGHHPGESMRCLAVLCLHPIGYYSRSWAGCMVPSDDVIAHLTWMRGDEAGFWSKANQHDPASPEAGL